MTAGECQPKRTEDKMSANALIKVDQTSAQLNERIQLVSFTLANEEYGVEVLKVREII